MRDPGQHRIPILLLVTSFGLSCGRIPAPGATSASANATGPAALPGAGVHLRPLDGDAIVKLAYGDKAGPRKAADWRPKRLWQGQEGPGFDAGTEFICESSPLLPFRQGDALRAFVVTSARPTDYECLSCEPLLGVVALTEASEGWRVDSMDLEVGTYGFQGHVPISRVVTVGPDRSGVLLESTFMTTGITIAGLSIVAEQRDGRFAQILSVNESDSDNAGSCGDAEGGEPCWAFGSSWTFVKAGGHDLWDFEITKKGTRPVSLGEKEIVEFSEKNVYRFDGAKYVLVK